MTGSELKAIRERLGLNQDALAVLVGVSGGRTVRRWENGERKVPRSIEIILAEAAVARGTSRR